MKFLCTKVKSSWLTSDLNRKKVEEVGLLIKDVFVGLEVKNEEPSEEENLRVNNAVSNLFGSHIQAFPVRLINL